MNRIIWRIGAIISAIIILPSAIMVLLGGNEFDYSFGEIIGYASIILSLLLTFVGVKQYRDKHNDGIISFGQALKMGLLIILIPSTLFGAYNVVYAEIIDPEFNRKYFDHSIEQLKATSNKSAAELEVEIADLEAQYEMFTNPVMSFALMFVTVFVIGLIVVLISALVLKRNAPPQSGNVAEASS